MPAYASLGALLVIAASQSPTSVEVRPKVTLTIVKGARAGAAEWKTISTGQKRELVREENGVKVRLLLTEYE